MRKILVGGVVALACAGAVCAEIAQQAVSSSLVTTAVSTNVVPVRGVVRNIYFDIPSGKTGAVSVVSSEGFTILNVSGVTADTLYAPRSQRHLTAGTALGTNDVDAIAVVGDVTVTITPAANTTGTNNWAVKINYER